VGDVEDAGRLGAEGQQRARRLGGGARRRQGQRQRQVGQRGRDGEGPARLHATPRGRGSSQRPRHCPRRGGETQGARTVRLTAKTIEVDTPGPSDCNGALAPRRLVVADLFVRLVRFVRAAAWDVAWDVLVPNVVALPAKVAEHFYQHFLAADADE